MYVNQYAEPSNYGIPSPYGPRIHNWKDGPLNEGSLYHGPIYTRPAYQLPWIMQPLNGAAEDEFTERNVLLARTFERVIEVLYPDLSDRYQELKSGTGDTTEEFEVRTGTCVQQIFPLIEEHVLGELEDPSSGGIGTFVNRDGVESILFCIESGETKLSKILLPLAAVGSLIVVWLLLRKKR